MALSKNGTQLAVISGMFDEVEAASIRSGNSDHGIPLRDFRGRTLQPHIPDTVDDPGAAFSSSGTFLRSVKIKTLSGSGGRATVNYWGVSFSTLRRADVLWMVQLVYLQSL